MEVCSEMALSAEQAETGLCWPMKDFLAFQFEMLSNLNFIPRALKSHILSTFNIEKTFTVDILKLI